MPTLVLRIPLPAHSAADPAPHAMEALESALGFLRAHDLREWAEFPLHDRAGVRAGMATVEDAAP
jgi:hypothetical protein